jgi:serine/threonine-protein kinase
MDSGSFAIPALGPLAGAPLVRPPAEKFGRYYLLDRIAVGGMAEVHKAVTRGVEGFRRTFVVKKILSDKASSPTFVRMFCDEARISALLHHPNIVQVYDFGHVKGTYFLAMEYLPGKDLSSLLRVLRAAKASVPPSLAAYIAREVAVGLHHAHALRGSSGQPLGIVHRDVTPSNIMLLYAGGVKVLDFGIAKVSTVGGGPPTEGGGVKGKYGYLAPEQARGGDVDGRADVFALGVTLWEMLVGRRLFAGKNDLETLGNVLQKPVPPPSSLRPGIPPELDRIVLRALERSRDARYATAEELARDCDAVLATARADSQSLRSFLNDLFAEESSSASFEALHIPEELLGASGPVSAPVLTASSDGVPRDSSMEIVVGGAPEHAGRARTPAPPFGVIASEAAAPGVSSWRARLQQHRTWAAAAVVVVCLLGGLALAAQTRKAAPARPAAVAAPAPVRAATPVVAPVAVPEPAPVVAAPSLEERPAPQVHRPRAKRARDLSADLTLNPF